MTTFTASLKLALGPPQVEAQQDRNPLQRNIASPKCNPRIAALRAIRRVLIMPAPRNPKPSRVQAHLPELKAALATKKM